MVSVETRLAPKKLATKTVLDVYKRQVVVSRFIGTFMTCPIIRLAPAKYDMLRMCMNGRRGDIKRSSVGVSSGKFSGIYGYLKPLIVA